MTKSEFMKATGLTIKSYGGGEFEIFDGDILYGYVQDASTPMGRGGGYQKTYTFEADTKYPSQKTTDEYANTLSELWDNIAKWYIEKIKDKPKEQSYHEKHFGKVKESISKFEQYLIESGK